MTFKRKLNAAGFRLQTHFAKHAGVLKGTVTEWSKKTPQLVQVHLDALIEIIELKRQLAEREGDEL